MSELIPFTIKIYGELLKAIHETYDRHGERTAEFIRKAIIERLEAKGIEVRAELKNLPTRRGVGGWPTHRANRRWSQRGTSDRPRARTQSTQADEKR